MTPYSNGLGNELGQGLGDFARAMIGTQNTLQQQAEQKAQADRAAALQQQQLADQRARDAEQQRQFNANQGLT